MHNFAKRREKDPKPKRIKLTGKAKTQLRKDLHDRAKGKCESCNKHLPLYIFDHAGEPYFDEFRCGHVSHIKSRGAGGDDTMGENGSENNVIWECFECHRARHDGYLIYID